MAMVLLVLADEDEVWCNGEICEGGDARWYDVGCVCELWMEDV